MSNLKTQNQNLNLKSNLKYRAYKFSLMVIKFVSGFPEKKIYWIIGDQLLRAATSIGANIIEAQASSSKREFIKYYEIALKSANETKYWLCLLRDGNLVNKEEVGRILKEAEEISNMLGSSLLTLKGKKKF
ncbi:MAG: four helix bundle protein [Patescibacteria group bacterium]